MSDLTDQELRSAVKIAAANNAGLDATYVDELERRAFVRGFDAGRAEERRDVVAGVERLAAPLYPHARGPYDAVIEMLRTAAHLPAKETT
jgi:hypothetical protein